MRKLEDRKNVLGKKREEGKENKNWRKSGRNVKKDKKKILPPPELVQGGPAKVKFQKILMNATK